MKYNIVPDDEALSVCACCQKEITAESDVLDVGVRIEPDIDLAEYASHCIEINLKSVGRPVNMMVPSARSDAKQEGKDGLFLLCSQTCAETFIQCLQAETSQGGVIQSVLD